MVTAETDTARIPACRDTPLFALFGKITRILTSLAGWTGLTLLIYVNMRYIRMELELTVVRGILRSFSFFTVWINLLVSLGVTLPLLFPRRRTGRFFSIPQTVSGLLVYILVVGLIYHVFLARIWNPRGIHKLADVIQHYVVPILFALYWTFIPKGQLRFRMVPAWLVFPALYFLFILLIGSITGTYPYPFFDVPRLGLGQVMTNAGAITLALSLTGLAVVGLDKLLGRTRLRR
jgi:hypothetical protein